MPFNELLEGAKNLEPAEPRSEVSFPAPAKLVGEVKGDHQKQREFLSHSLRDLQLER
jgi:hypothetical protein